MSELRTCPFCGGSPIREAVTLDERFSYAEQITYRCTGCRCARSAKGDTSKSGYADNSTVEKRAIKAWNQRPKT